MNGYERAQPPLLKSITAKNLLSFGPEGMTLDLEPLNVLVGPNGSGKTNLLEVIGLFRAAPGDIEVPIDWGGGIREWIWKGQPHSPAIAEVLVSYPTSRHYLKHKIAFTETAQQFELVDERVENDQPDEGKSDVFFFYRFQEGYPVLSVKGQDKARSLQRESVTLDESILAQISDPVQFPELAYLSNQYRRIRLYRNWEFGPDMAIRDSQRANTSRTALSENFRNLGVFLNKLRQTPSVKARFIEELSDLYDSITDFELNFEGGTVQIFFTEGEFNISATRISDGSLRYLCLLAILLDPNPPPLICIEEPEMGLHPDLMHKLADLLVDASSRCQLVVTTHSDILVDALTDHPEAVVVCEKQEGQTIMNRLDKSNLEQWLEKYRLGDLWVSGELGGVRW